MCYLSPLFAGGCDYLNEIAVKCVNRRATQEELDYFKICDSVLRAQDTLAIKRKYIDYIMAESDFIEQIVLFMRFQIIKGTSFEDVYKQIQDFNVLSIMLPLDMDEDKEKALYQFETDRLYKVYLLANDLSDKAIAYEDIYYRLFNNFFYDTQNMGEDNFINSTFQYSLGRNPTALELKNSISMLNEDESTLFYKKGNSKTDYLKILVTNNNFYENQVKYWYYYFLLDYPDDQTTYDILFAIKKAGNKVNIEQIIKHILTYYL